MEIYFVRHGQTPSNAIHAFASDDEPLSEQGRHEASVVADRMRAINPEVIIVSGYARAQETASYIGKATSVQSEVFEALHEYVPPSRFVGVPGDDPEKAAYMKEFKGSFANLDWKFEDAENYLDIEKRLEACAEMLESRTEERVVVVSHGGFIKFLTAYLLWGKSHEEYKNVVKFWNAVTVMDNAGISVCTYKDGVWKLKIWNDIAHFAE